MQLSFPQRVSSIRSWSSSCVISRHWTQWLAAPYIFVSQISWNIAELGAGPQRDIIFARLLDMDFPKFPSRSSGEREILHGSIVLRSVMFQESKYRIDASSFIEHLNVQSNFGTLLLLRNFSEWIQPQLQRTRSRELSARAFCIEWVQRARSSDLLAQASCGGWIWEDPSLELLAHALCIEWVQRTLSWALPAGGSQCAPFCRIFSSFVILSWTGYLSSFLPDKTLT